MKKLCAFSGRLRMFIAQVAIAVAIAVMIAVAIPTSLVAQTEFTSQDSAKTKYHSGIVTSKGVVWDTDFAKMVTNAIGAANYNEIGFAFMQCFGGGMIDELLAAKLKNASYTSAARSDEVSWSFPPGLISTPQNAAKTESTYNMPYAPVAGGPTAFTLNQAAVVGRNNDPVGPVLNLGTTAFPNGLVFPGLQGAKLYAVLEHPQYTSDGAVGDSVTLHRVNPNNKVANDNYLAVVFGGSTKELGNTNSVARIKTALTDRGYVKAEQRIVDPGGSAKDLKAAWDFVKANTTPTTQIYYWNSWGHGTRGFDFNGVIKQVALNGVPVPGTVYGFDLTSDFVSDVLGHFNYVQSLGDTNPQDSPYVEIQTSLLVSNFRVMLNGSPLSPLGVFDIFEDGSVFDYRFALSSGNLQQLSTSDTVSLNWDGPLDPGFGLGIINTGDLSNFETFIAEPSSLIMLMIGACSLGVTWVYRRWRFADASLPLTRAAA